jgi:hypothetical protein
VFLCGATGFSYYSYADFTDMAYFLKIAAVVRLLSPYEDLIADGTPAHSEVTAAQGCIVSAMALDGEVLFGVTPTDPHRPLSFAFAGGAGTGTHKLVNVQTGETVKETASASFTVSLVVDTTTVLRFAPVPTASLDPTRRP